MPGRIKPLHHSTGLVVRDIGGSNVKSLEKEHINEYFVKPHCNRKLEILPMLPEELLYSGEGILMWSKVIYDNTSYYQTEDEKKLLDKYGPELAGLVRDGSAIIDLGAGDTRKVSSFLRTLDDRGIRATYYALDISHDALEVNVNRLAGERYRHVRCKGLWGTFEDLYKKLDSGKFQKPRIFLSLGSVLFNDHPQKAKEHLRSLARHMRLGDILLAGMDGHCSPEDYDKVKASYDSHGNMHLQASWMDFFKNGFQRANQLYEGEDFRLEDWEVTGKVAENPVRHQFIFKAKRTIVMDKLKVIFQEGQEFEWFDAHKNGIEEVSKMSDDMGLEVVKVLKLEDSKMYQYLIQKS